MKSEIERAGNETSIGKIIIVKIAFLVMSIGGITIIWNLPRPLSDVSILLGIGWIILTSKFLAWFFIRIGWTTKERENGVPK